MKPHNCYYTYFTERDEDLSARADYHARLRTRRPLQCPEAVV